jgi:outer membrane protein TolC
MGPRLARRAGAAWLLALSFAFTSAAAAAAAELGATLDGLLAHARERHPELRAMRHDAEAAAERVLPAGSLPDPMFQAELRDVTNEMAGGSPNLLPARVGSTRYQFRQTFPAWGSRDAKRDAAQAASDEAALRAEATWTELAMRIKTAYAVWQRAHAQVEQQRELLALVDRMESAAQVRYAGGLAPQQDAIRAQLERTAMASELAMLEAEISGTRARINSLLTRPADAPLAAPLGQDALPSLARLDMAALRERVLARNPALAAEDARIRAAEKSKDAVWSNRYPEFTLGVAPVQTRNRISEWELMFEVNIPLQQKRRRAEEREALAMVSAAQARKEAAANEAVSQLGEALSALEAAHRVATLTQTSLLPQAQISLQSALAGYESGKVDFATVLEAQRQIRQARLTLIRTQADARMRLAEIERLIGGAL